MVFSPTKSHPTEPLPRHDEGRQGKPAGARWSSKWIPNMSPASIDKTLGSFWMLDGNYTEWNPMFILRLLEICRLLQPSKHNIPEMLLLDPVSPSESGCGLQKVPFHLVSNICVYSIKHIILFLRMKSADAIFIASLFSPVVRIHDDMFLLHVFFPSWGWSKSVEKASPG